MLEMIKRFFEYAAWTMPRILEALKTVPQDAGAAAKPFAHLLIAEKVWLMRLKGHDTSTMDLAPELSLDECEALANDNQTGYRDFLNGLSEEELGSLLRYKNSKGLEFETPLRDILIHVAIHGAYHRGQVSFAVRAAGGAPLNTDYISFVR